MGERRDELLIHGIAATIEALRGGAVGIKAAALLHRVGQLAKGIGQFQTADIELEPLRHTRVRRVWPGQGRH